MALPILNDTPTYNIAIPSTGKKVKFRPYLVKEEKILLMANETKDPDEILRAIVETLRACSFGTLDVSNLATFDVEYLFLRVRARSVGENVTLFLPCAKCETRNEYVMNLDNVACPVDDNKDMLIPITDSISVEMQYRSHEDTFQGDETKDMVSVIASCIRAVVTEDERIGLEDETEEEIQKFLESLTREQFKVLADFVKDLPQVQYLIKFDCESCGEDNEIEIKGFENFF